MILRRAIAGCVLLAVFLLSRAFASNHEEQAAEFFENTNLLTFQIELDPPALGQLARRPRSYVPGRVKVGSKVLENVGIRLKGSGTFQSVFEHPSLALKFNWKEEDQHFEGLSKLFLENSGQDATRMCKVIANGAYLDCGIPAPRITQAKVILNQNELGLYIVSEAINKGFLKQHFGNSSGNLYEAFFSDITRGLKQANGTPGDQSDLRELTTAALEKDVEHRKQTLPRLLDANEFLDFLALEMILANWDGYAFHQNNYRIYHQPNSGRMSFIPHDLDNTLFESGMGLLPPRTGVLTAAFLAGPQERKQFGDRIARLLPIALDPDRVRQRVQACIARLSQGATPEELETFQWQGDLVERRVRERRENLKAELTGQHPPTPVFDSGGVAALSGWAPKTDWNNAALSTVEEDGKPSLCIEAAGNYCFGSWRLPVWLPAGRYRLEGEAKTRGVTGLPSQTGSGAGVRVLGGRRGGGIQGDCTHWTPVRHEFVVQEGCERVELIAELRAFSGTAWFDPNTLRLIRIK